MWPVIFVLILGCVPFATRTVEFALQTVPRGIIRAAQLYGAPFLMVFVVCLQMLSKRLYKKLQQKGLLCIIFREDCSALCESLGYFCPSVCVVQVWVLD